MVSKTSELVIFVSDMALEPIRQILGLSFVVTWGRFVRGRVLAG